MQESAPLKALERARATGGDNAVVEEAVAILKTAPASSDGRAAALEALEMLASERDRADAMWLLGAWYLQRPQDEGAPALSAAWLQRAADAKVALAIDRLANLHLRGLGVEYAPERSLALLTRLADHAFQNAAWDSAWLLDTLGRTQEAVTGFARACALGYPPAYYSLGLRFARGAGVSRDPDFAAALLRRANDAGHPDAAGALNEELGGAARSEASEGWYRRLVENVERANPVLDRAASSSPILQPSKVACVAELEEIFSKLGHPSIALRHGRIVVAGNGRGDATLKQDGELVWHARRPRVGVRENFLSREECAHLIALANQSIGRPGDYQLNTRNGALEASLFDGAGRSLGGLDSDTVTRVVERRLADCFDISTDRIEPISIIRYRPGEEYRPHVDYFMPEQLRELDADCMDRGGQRVATVLLCLRPAERGGDTSYPEAGVSIRYRRGMLAVHYNVDAHGRAEPASIHRGESVEVGEKWLARTTLRQRSRYTGH